MSRNSQAKALIKELAMQAKERLKNSNYSQIDGSFGYKKPFDRRNYKVLSKMDCKKPDITIKIINDTVDEENFNRRVYALLQENEDISNPLNKLIDKEAFDSFSEFEQEKYILELADKYTKARENYLQQSSSC